MFPSDPDVLVIGAGCAGIAAARELALRGRTCVVLEAGPRVGGRAWTESDSLGAPFDHGASWLHQADENPLTPFAHALGLAPIDHDRFRERRLFAQGRLAPREERHAFAAAEDAFWTAIDAAARDGAADRPASDAAPRGGPWDATVAHWEGAQICAAELTRMSLHDVAATALDGPNLIMRTGVGGLVARLAEGLPIRLDARVDRLRWGARGVSAEGAFGSITARAAIVTVSTGVLAAGGIAFDPPLPAETQAAIHALPLGLLTKIAFRADHPDAPDMPPFVSLRRAVEHDGDRPMSWISRLFGDPLMIAFCGGARAWEMAGDARRAEAEARAEAAKVFGARAAAALGPATVTRWAEDPLFRGAYSHAVPGAQAARTTLARPLDDGRLCFAGEACHPRFAATVAGAWLSGVEAARAIP
ncbi:flavin monoamine oxidase family protein [Neoroseomonas oryzicola]|uniref:Tryptophan 2-monooxygenase n=1 Tax=Neoroseomonas oryzicola TaxID=535904 RepID=A0A9X9WJI6_9PROT|nr:NAD(P)/FAD-dependent oxidoreductase [Neoroseomonas oryzicola]MBR0660496.1 FAD-dependent oxidoreductase [Neoroseomonas oryzicola]NKE18264.1 FAD-dependent oxidoreductase [Neoroseomonas oryzicola]